VDLLTRQLSFFQQMISIIAELLMLVSLAPRKGWIIILISIISPILQNITGSLSYSIPFNTLSNRVGSLEESTENAVYTEHLTRAETMKEFAFSVSMRPELILFNLKDWIIKEYQKSSKIIKEMEQPRNSITLHRQIYHHLTNLLQTGSRVILYLLVALKSDYFDIPLSLLLYLEQSSQSLFLKTWGIWNRIDYIFHDMMRIQELFQCLELQPVLKVPAADEAVPYETSKFKDGFGMKIELRGVSYKYPGAEEFVLENVSFSLEAGETLALLGLNGSGITISEGANFREIDVA
jgi:ABC-type multidrug transport system fused ATPase/permease subunit